jgi:hypothetical protein
LNREFIPHHHMTYPSMHINLYMHLITLTNKNLRVIHQSYRYLFFSVYLVNPLH